MFITGKVLFAYLLLGTWSIVFALKSQNMDPVDMADWNLPSDTKYAKFHKLSVSDFHQRVLQSRDAWIVVIYEERLDKKWKSHAERLKATLWYGSINYKEEQDFVQELIPDVEQYDLKLGIALVFPFGRNKLARLDKNRKKWPKVVSEPKEAENVLRPTFPDITNQFTFNTEDMKHFQTWIVNAYYNSNPPKFPVLCIIDKPDSDKPLSLLAISNYFSNFFAFAVVDKTNVQKLLSMLKQIPYPRVFPHYLLLLGKEPSSDQMKEGKYGITFDIMPFNNLKYGDSDRFLAVVKFLFTANEDYREKLLGRHSDEPVELSNMQPIRDALTNRWKEIQKVDFLIKTEL